MMMPGLEEVRPEGWKREPEPQLQQESIVLLFPTLWLQIVFLVYISRVALNRAQSFDWNLK